MLSVVSPAHAIEVAQRVAAAGGTGLYADLNAISPKRAAQVAEIVASGGFRPIDGGIVGGPPRESYTPTIYLSGGSANDAAAPLAGLGLRVTVLEGGIGRASALKLSYAGVTKGLTALGAAMLLAADRAGVAEDLVAELRTSQPELARRFGRAIPDMLPKAERWVPEMNEIAEFVGSGQAEHAIYRDVADLYARLSGDPVEDGGGGGGAAPARRSSSARADAARPGRYRHDVPVAARIGSGRSERRRGWSRRLPQV